VEEGKRRGVLMDLSPSVSFACNMCLKGLPPRVDCTCKSMMLCRVGVYLGTKERGSWTLGQANSNDKGGVHFAELGL
jgi:hypothetical protein